MKRFDWYYKREDGVSESNLENAKGTVNVKTIENEETGETYYQGTIDLKLPKEEAEKLGQEKLEQLRGNLIVKAVDNAGLSSAEYTDTGNIIVVDTISPTEKISRELLNPTENTPQPNIVEEEGVNHYYYAGAVRFIFDIKEANFFAEDVVIKAVRSDKNNEDVTPMVEWNKVKDKDEYIAVVDLKDEGDYVVTMEYKERMAHTKGHYAEENAISVYKSEEITIDTTPPEVSFDYSNGNNKSASADNSQSATVTN